MTSRLNRWFTYASVAAICGFVLSSSCARQPIESLEEPNEEITVSGSFADWSATANSFSNGMFVLLDSSTNEVYSGNISSNSFKIEKVPSQGKFYGLLIGPDFQVRGLMQKTAADGALKYYIFRLGQTAGNLGTLVVGNAAANGIDALESSQQSELDFQTTLGASKEGKEGKEFTGEYSSNFAPSPDIDGDGIPNMLDTNADGDRYDNIIDRQTYAGNALPDAKIPWQHNYANGIPKAGFFKCDQLRKADSSFEFWCILKLPAGLAEKVTLKSFGVDTEMFDDGGKSQAAHGDSTAGDGVWNSRFSLEANKSFFPRQLVMATVTLAGGGSKKFLTTLGPVFPYTVRFHKVDNNPFIELSEKELNTKVVVANWPQTAPPKGLLLEILLLDAADQSFVKSFSVKLESGEPVGEGSAETLFPLVDPNIAELGLTKPTYRFKVRIIGPAALPGTVGSAAESAMTVEIPYPTPTTP